jgi:phosphoglycolate phosphatase-like HAD superfamily hydrolase
MVLSPSWLHQCFCRIGIITMFNFPSGSYAGFDEDAPTSESGGKPRVVKLLKEKYNYNAMAMIGDGATDMEASPPAVSPDVIQFSSTEP